jgi:hypothetical protein
MLAERLFEFAEALQSDYERTEIVTLLKQLSAALQAQANNPAGAEFQARVASTRANIEKTLSASSTESFPHSWRLLLKECNLEGFFGSGILKKLDNALTKNALTPTQAAADVKKLADDISSSSDYVDGLVSGLRWFEIRPSLLQAGDFEIDVTIPRPVIDNELGELGEEFKKIDRIIRFFNEVATGSREGARIIGIGSSDPTAYLEAFPATAAAFALATERVVALYGKFWRSESRMLI